MFKFHNDEKNKEKKECVFREAHDKVESSVLMVISEEVEGVHLQKNLVKTL